MKPVIINPNSNFVVVTYWWGRGNFNKNTQRPCPEELSEDEKLKIKKQPMTYDEMIIHWTESCKKAKCNHLSVEYPEFAQKGMYQKAINFKPTFIQKALEACYPRSVLYIDGDMHIKKYPHIFDLPIDFASRGWNSDPRSSMIDFDDAVCYYPYVFETSGGTMFYGNTPMAKQLLNYWREITSKFPLKADDRLLSTVFNMKKLLLSLNYIPLPIEYLWLSDDYDGMDSEMSTRRNIFIEHPACLTGEDRAAAEGAATDRIPPRYDAQITNKVVCRGRGMPFWEFIYFPKKSLVTSFQPYLRFMDSKNLLDLVEYSDKYGKEYNKVAVKNLELAKKVKVDKSQKTAILNKPTIPEILAYLKKGINVIVTKGSSSRGVSNLLENVNYDFICKNLNVEIKRYKKEYTLKIDKDKPIYFGANNEVLKHLVTMSSTLSNLEKIFNSSFIFISRIRCKW